MTQMIKIMAGFWGFLLKIPCILAAVIYGHGVCEARTCVNPVKCTVAVTLTFACPGVC